MFDSKKLTGFSWHKEYLKMDENDSRRDKRKCIHFSRTESNKNYCKKNYMNCIGSSHCSFYEKSDTIIKENFSRIKKIQVDDVEDIQIFEIKVFNDRLYQEVIKFIKNKFSVGYKDIVVKNLHSYEIIGNIRCLTNINGENFFIISESEFKRFTYNRVDKSININFKNMDLEAIRSFLITIFSYRNVYKKSKKKMLDEKLKITKYIDRYMEDLLKKHLL